MLPLSVAGNYNEDDDDEETLTDGKAGKTLQHMKWRKWIVKMKCVEQQMDAEVAGDVVVEEEEEESRVFKPTQLLV